MQDWWAEANWGGAACWAELFNMNFLRMNMTSTIAWSLVWSVYPAVDVFEGFDPGSPDGYWGPGLMYAYQPWSNHYEVNPTVWASAHTCQFVEPGWKMLHDASGHLRGGGTFVTMVSPDEGDFSTIFQTAKGTQRCGGCYTPAESATAPQSVEITLTGTA